MVYYVSVKVIIIVSGLAEVIIDMIVHHDRILESIVMDQSLFFISEFWFSLCYFLGIKWKQSTTFYSQTNSQTKRKNSVIKVYFRAFVNWKQDDWARLLLMAKFAYNNAKNASISHISLELSCDYYPKVSFEENVDLHSRSCSANKLAKE